MYPGKKTAVVWESGGSQYSRWHKYRRWENVEKMTDDLEEWCIRDKHAVNKIAINR